MFDLHPRLASDTFDVYALPLSRVLLMNDARYPWIILVPARPGLVELHDLTDDDYALLSGEIRNASARMATLFGAHKMNVAALGNMVPQLHIHVIARQPDDAAWPALVWGKGDALPYEAAAAEDRLRQIRDALDGL
ncbi:MAG: diadenosine tetraphosphate hydrolase [Sneathiella sp.]|uniref:HIT domain-containing protein n=1 Tax=Sneathiella sp. TaxID=1964365 RepID=UPI000C5AF065|nr:HIT domain-containing protein [Sneathiella sp.]MAZ04055.1 diadenosine tetraphosphate hydrolase [Sneathiella sp.]